MAGLAFITRNLPTLPATSQMRTARPTHGDTVAALADYAAHLLAYRRLRVVSMLVEGAVDVSTHYAPQLVGRADLRYTTGPIATHLWVAVAYNAQDRPATGGEPIVDAVLETPAGVALDPGVRWRQSNGTLPAYSAEDAGFGPGFIGVQHVYTPSRASAGDGGAQSVPRPLVLPAPGSDVVVRLAWTNCRVYGLTVIELYREAIAV
jgi:hypothetical protein